MKLVASPPSSIHSIFRLARRLTALGSSAGVSMLLLGAGCSSSDEPGADVARPSGNGGSQAQGESPTPAAAPAGTPTTNNESMPAPALDGAGAAGTAAEGVSAAADAGVPASDGDAAPSAAPDDAGAPPPISDPTQDENLVFILEDGFQTTYFVSECRSIGDDGTVIEGVAGGTLPVGGGFILECSMENLPSRATTDVLSASDEPWCALGELSTYEAGGDERLTVTIVTPPDVSPAFLIATREGERVDLAQAAAFGALIWPVWVDATYDVNEVAPAQGRLCDDIFGL